MAPATLPILLLIGAGFGVRALGLLRAGDERALNGYLYWLALPSLFVSDLAQVPLTLATLRFMALGALPALVLGGLILLLRPLARDLRYLLALTTVFGSLAFFGIPFVEFSLGPGEPVRLAALAVAGIAPFTVALSLVLLEAHGSGGMRPGAAVRRTVGRLSRNPLLLSLAVGLLLALTGIRLPPLLATPLATLGRTTAPVALVTLGVFLYGRDYRALLSAVGLAAPRLLLLPALTLLATAWAGLSPLEGSVLVVMNGTPIAVNTIVLSSRYRFHEERIAPLILVSSLGSLLTLNLWLLAARKVLGG
ncbi:MAG: AEC family transporter [Candidatus Bipolaricaulota bacterium]|nr:AEC family transporter [Candidatus Bipolaricaulota bacterium]